VPGRIVLFSRAIGLTSQSVPAALYPRLLGTAWAELPAVVRGVHAGGAEMRTHGRFRVRGAASVLTRVVARLAGLPREGETDMDLHVLRDARGETWRRRFGEDLLVTRQEEEDGCLVEEIGMLQLRFELAAAEGALRFRQVGARIGRGRFRAVVPRWLAPVVTARAWAQDGLRVQVEVRTAGGRLLCAYEGVLTADGGR
jgi:Domain of unknown function (DUF4166)